MGGGLSIEQSDKQSTSNTVSQESIERCSIAQGATQSIHINAQGGSIDNDNFNNGILSNSASCALKASLTSTLINTQSNTQGATQVDIPGIFTVLSDMVGSNDDINQSNSQNIANQATQLMNSLCQDNQTAPQTININLNNTSLDNTTFNNFVKSNKFNCVLDNMSSFYAQNSQTNSQVATQIRIDSMVFIALIIAAAVVLVAAIKYGRKKKNKGGVDDLGIEAESILEPASIPKHKGYSIPNPTFSRKKV
jgi:hypothetical protein